ncbi:MAG: flotillin family protein [bacterium]|nr:flotillin family protein [bacterium]
MLSMGLLIPIGIGLLIVIFFLILVNGAYVKAPPNQVFIISGMGKQPRVFSGTAGFMMPFLERLDKLSLSQMTVDIRTETPVPTNDFINVNVDAVAKVRVLPTTEGINLAAKNFLNKTEKEIVHDLQDSLQGNMREIIGTLDLRSLNTDRDSFSKQVVIAASSDMEKLGIEIISCNIQNITDEKGLIDALGADNAARIKKDAAIAKAVADKEVAIAQAKADREANEEQVKAETEISVRRNDLRIKQFELQKESEIKRAESEAAYEIQNQEQQKTIQEATVNAQIARAERDAELKRKQVAVKEEELNATIRKQAEAERYQKEQQADADRYQIEQKALADLAKRQREAEAQLFEEQKHAEARKAAAEAELYNSQKQAEAIQAKAEAEAAGVRAKGLAEAEAIRAKGEAEANALDKKAEAMRKYGEGAILQMALEALPKVAEQIAKPMEKIGNITVFDGGDGNGTAAVTSSTAIAMGRVMQAVKETTGIDIKNLVEGSSKEAVINRNITVHGLEGGATINPTPKK